MRSKRYEDLRRAFNYLEKAVECLDDAGGQDGLVVALQETLADIEAEMDEEPHQ